MRTTTSNRTSVLMLIGVLIAALGLVATAQIASSKPTVATPVISSGPATLSPSTAATFTITTANGTQLQCVLDVGAFTACSSPRTYTGLTQGSHTFSVKATQGSDQSAAASYSWTVDTAAPPAPSIPSRPANPAASTNATFTLADTEAGVSFRCALDSAAYVVCSTPKTYSALSQGSHTVSVQAVDGAGNASPATAYTWTIDTVAPAAPVYTAKPADPTQNATNTFAWTTSESGLTFQCSMENGVWFSCTSPYTWVIDTSNNGQHQFAVRAIDAAGNISAGNYYSFKYEKGLPATGMPFQITGSVSGLAIGLTKPIIVTLTNPNPVQIYITSVTVGVDTSKDPTGCASGTNLQLMQSNVSSTLAVIVPANGSVTLPAQGATTPQILLKDLPTNQDACKAKNFALTYTGSAHN